MADLTGLLDRVTRGKKKRPRRLMLYGMHCVGKSTFASRAPDPIFLDMEDGLDEIDCASFPLIKNYLDVLQALTELYRESHDYKTIVIDSLDWLERVIWEAVCKDQGQDNIEGFGFGKGYGIALGYWRRIIAGLDLLRYEKKMSTILIAHSKIEHFESPETESYDRYVPRLHKSATGLITEWCDEVFFATYKIFARKVKEGFGRERTLPTSEGDLQRIVRTQERPFCLAKSRAKMPEEMGLEWSEYATNLRNENETGKLQSK
jgi:hypothetical protein